MVRGPLYSDGMQAQTLHFWNAQVHVTPSVCCFHSARGLRIAALVVPE